MGTTESAEQRLFDIAERLSDKVDSMQTVVNDVKIDVATIKERQEKHYVLNDREHQNMVSIIADTREDIDNIKNEITGLKENDDNQQSILDKRTGMHSALKWAIGIFATIASGGIGWFLAKMG